MPKHTPDTPKAGDTLFGHSVDISSLDPISFLALLYAQTTLKCTDVTKSITKVPHYFLSFRQIPRSRNREVLALVTRRPGRQVTFDLARLCVGRIPVLDSTTTTTTTTLRAARPATHPSV
ncbi:hypothetical protein CC2G_008342 [Coprinopsis cinerea AmutBmut pab1-1]|nr:hypothetical protein CC2G_008342 [Coprinopsis cinerea AmutBmut pab1-1]